MANKIEELRRQRVRNYKPSNDLREIFENCSPGSYEQMFINEFNELNTKINRIISEYEAELGRRY